MKFEGLTVIVTGAGHGIGRGVAEAYAREGASVVLAELNEETGSKAAKEISEAGGKVLFVPCDVRKESNILNLMEAAAMEFGHIDILVNNAGIGNFKPTFELTIEEWDNVLNTNARGCFLASRAAANYMKNNANGGSIVNMASTRSIMSEAGTEAYSASKGAIVALTHALAVSLGRYQIRVNCISPGWVETGDYSKLREMDHKQHPAGRVGKPEDIAKACFYLSDPYNTFVTGVHLVVDGGMTRNMIYEPD